MKENENPCKNCDRRCVGCKSSCVDLLMYNILVRKDKPKNVNLYCRASDKAVKSGISQKERENRNRIKVKNSKLLIEF